MVTGQAFLALLPELISTGFLILVLMVGVFAESNTGRRGGPGRPGNAGRVRERRRPARDRLLGQLLRRRLRGRRLRAVLQADSRRLGLLRRARGGALVGQTGDAPEYLTLILSVVLGSTLLVSMRDLFGIFLAIELATIPSYAMVAFDRSRRESAEGGMKYLITGVIASSVLLYGIVLIYGVSGSAMLSRRCRHVLPAPHPCSGARARANDLRLRLQALGGALPLLDPGRLPGRPDERRRLPLGRA